MKSLFNVQYTRISSWIIRLCVRKQNMQIIQLIQFLQLSQMTLFHSLTKKPYLLSN